MADSSARYHHGNLRAELLFQAERKLESVGVAGLSLRELARDIGVSHGAPRPHFSDKNALLDALAVVGLERLGAQLDGALGNADDSFQDRLTAFARAYVGFAKDHPALLALMFERKDKADAPELHAANVRAFAAPSALIADAFAAGEIADPDPDRVAMAVLATIHGLASIVINDMIGDRSVGTVVDGTIATLIHGLAGRTSGRA